MKPNKLIGVIALTTAAFSVYASDITKELTFKSGAQSYQSYSTSFSESGYQVLDGDYDVFTFALPVGALPGTYHVVTSFFGTNVDIDWAKTNLNGQTGTALSSGWSYDFGSITANTTPSFVLTLFGNREFSMFSSQLTGTIDATLLPVPELPSYAMLLAGLGLMGTIASRRSRGKDI